MLAAAFGWWLAGWPAALILAAVAAVADTVRVARTWSDAEPARASIEELLPEILDGTLQPGKVFDRTVSLDEVPAGARSGRSVRSSAAPARLTTGSPTTTSADCAPASACDGRGASGPQVAVDRLAADVEFPSPARISVR
jgi:hypothetical protein